MTPRNELALFVGQRILVTGYFDRLARYENKRTGQIEVTALIQEIFYQGQRIVDHTFVQGAIIFQRFDPQKGERVEFTVRVGKYKKRDQASGTLVDCHNLEFPGDIYFLDREVVAST